MRRIGCVDEVCIVARVTSCRRPLEYVVHMTGGAGQGRVRASECVACKFQVVELGVEPRIDGVAGLACRGESGRNVIEYGGMKVLLMAGVAGR